MKKVFIVLLIIGVIMSSSVLAENIYDLQQDLDWLDKQIENTIYQRKEAEEDLDFYGHLAEEMNRNLTTQLEELENKEERIEALGKTINDFIESIARTELEYAKKLTLLKNRIVDGYIDSKTNLLSLFVDSENISDFYEKIEIKKYITLHDKELIDEVDMLAIDLAEKLARAEALKIDFEVSKRFNELAIQNINELKTTANETVVLSTSQIAVLEAKEDQLIQDADDTLKIIRKLQAEMVYAGGDMIWPVPANRGALSKGDRFGMRMHPIFHYMRMHTGIDIGAPNGANILAANAGTVIMVGWSTGYGNRVVIDHGGAIATLYAHCSKMLVKLGDDVAQGQVIALIGETGWATGPHLHFEVMEAGERVDPLKFVTQKSGT